MIPTLETARLLIRPLSVDDAEALFPAYSDHEVMRYWSSAPHESLDDTRAYLGREADKDAWRGWAMTLKADGSVIGTLYTGEGNSGVQEIGYLLVRRYWGQGYAREGLSRLIDLLLIEEGHRRVAADTDPDNEGSNGLLRRLGFTLEGRLRAEWETHIGVRDSFIWGLLREEWPGSAVV